MTEPLTWNSAYSHDEPTPIFDALTAEQERDEAPSIERLSLAEFLRLCWPRTPLARYVLGLSLVLDVVLLLATGVLR